jgi:RNA polymerase sigma-70 factor (ECF subfamily)
MDDKRLLLLMEKNPGRAIHEMMNLFGDSISTICRNFLYDCSEDDIEETIADTYINFWRNREKFKLNEKYSLKSYLYAIARNAARDKRRSLKKADIFSLEELELVLVSDENIEMEYEKKEMEAVLHSCLEAMKEPDKTVFLYRFFYGYKTSEIGEMLNLTTKKVENILYRGKEKLRKDLEERGICHG